jgi:hypothetical protein
MAILQSYEHLIKLDFLLGISTGARHSCRTIFSELTVIRNNLSDSLGLDCLIAK